MMKILIASGLLTIVLDVLEYVVKGCIEIKQPENCLWKGLLQLLQCGFELRIVGRGNRIVLCQTTAFIQYWAPPLEKRQENRQATSWRSIEQNKIPRSTGDQSLRLHCTQQYSCSNSKPPKKGIIV